MRGEVQAGDTNLGVTCAWVVYTMNDKKDRRPKAGDKGTRTGETGEEEPEKQTEEE